MGPRSDPWMDYTGRCLIMDMTTGDRSLTPAQWPMNELVGQVSERKCLVCSILYRRTFLRAQCEKGVNLVKRKSHHHWGHFEGWTWYTHRWVAFVDIEGLGKAVRSQDCPCLWCWEWRWQCQWIPGCVQPACQSGLPVVVRGCWNLWSVCGWCLCQSGAASLKGRNNNKY